MIETFLLNSLKNENIIKVKDFYELKNDKVISIMEYQDTYYFQMIVNKPEKP